MSAVRSFTDDDIEVINLPHIPESKGYTFGPMTIIPIGNVRGVYHGHNECLISEIERKELKVFRIVFPTKKLEIDIVAAKIPETTAELRQLAEALLRKQKGAKNEAAQFLGKDCHIIGHTNVLSGKKFQYSFEHVIKTYLIPAIYVASKPTQPPKPSSLHGGFHKPIKQYPLQPCADASKALITDKSKHDIPKMCVI